MDVDYPENIEENDQDDIYSFADSERFDEEEDVCSMQASESGSLNHRWRGWTSRPYGLQQNDELLLNIDELQHSDKSVPCAQFENLRRSIKPSSNEVPTLTQLTSQKVAQSFSFETIEELYANMRPGKHFPEGIMIEVLRHCFPDSIENIRLYSCLANGNSSQYSAGENIFLSGAVSDVFQIGYHISAVVKNSNASEHNFNVSRDQNYDFLNICVQGLSPTKQSFDVSMDVDRCRIISCRCSCSKSSIWCQHIVAVCLFRIRRSEFVNYRTAIWDSITSLRDIQLKKFAQYLINDLPSTYIPVAQKLIDHLRNPKSEINLSCGAPDPTAGGQDIIAIWCMDEGVLRENIRKILMSFVKPAPTVFCDVQTLSAASPAVFYEWSTLNQSHCSREPEALWNLLSIVREMLKRGDSNASILLHAITDECLSIDFILIRWYQISLTKSGHWAIPNSGKNGNNKFIIRQYNACSLCDEIVILWRLIALDPRLSDFERENLTSRFQLYHRTAVYRIWNIIGSLGIDNNSIINIVNKQGRKLSQQNATFSLQCFPGFFNALQSCYISWSNLIFYISGFDFPLSRHVKNQLSPTCNLLVLHQEEEQIKLQEMVNFEQVVINGGTFINGLLVVPKSKRRNKKKKAKKQQSKESSIKMNQLNHDKIKANYAIEQSEDSTLDADSVSIGFDDPGPSKISKRNTSSSHRNDAYDEALNTVFAHAHAELDPFAHRFAYCEALFTHGHEKAAVIVAKDLARELCTHYRNFNNSCQLIEDDVPSPISKHKPAVNDIENPQRFFPPCLKSIESTEKIVDILLKTVFVVRILLSKNEALLAGYSWDATSTNNFLALQLSLEAICIKRGPAATKWHEVYIHHLISELSELLNRIELGMSEVSLIRRTAHQCLDEIIQATPYRITVPPTKMANFVSNILFRSFPIKNLSNTPRKSTPQSQPMPTYYEPNDDELALDLALEVLGMPVYLSEVDHPVLCECIRQQRRDLQLAILLHNRDSLERVTVIMDRILDSRIHKMYENHHTNIPFFLDGTSWITHKYARHLNRKYPNDGQTPSANQATEGQTYFMYEIAKRLLVYAGGNQNTSMFNPLQHNGILAIGIPSNSAPHRTLHICSFLIGLYSLGLSNQRVNQSSTTWQTRTYSAHVSWIHSQALEIGKPALEIIKHTWKKHLTPTEVASLADRGSQSNDPLVVEEAALLALAILPNAYSLTAVESQKALKQCKETSPKLLEDACLAVEKAAEKNGVYPEVLFKVAHHWYDLYCESSQISPTLSMGSQLLNHYLYPSVICAQNSTIPLPSKFSGIPFPPNSYMQQFQPPNIFGLPPGLPPTTSAQNPAIGIGIVNQQRLVMQQIPFHCSAVQSRDTLVPFQPFIPTTSSLNDAPSIMPMPMMTVQPQISFSHSQPSSIRTCVNMNNQRTPYNHQIVPLQRPNNPPPISFPPGPSMVVQPPSMVQYQNQQRQALKGMRFLKNAHRVGMAAMTAMGMRSSEDNRNFNKFLKNAVFSDEIRWLLEVSIEIGDPDYIRIFCEKTIACVSSPFVLVDLLRELISFFQNFRRQTHLSQTQNPLNAISSNPPPAASSANLRPIHAQISNSSASNIGLMNQPSNGKVSSAQAKTIMLQNGYPGAVAELTRHSIEMCYNASYNKLNYSNFGEQDVEYICELAIIAKEVFSFLVPHQKIMLEAFLRHVKKQKACKPSGLLQVYQRVVAAIQANSAQSLFDN